MYRQQLYIVWEQLRKINQMGGGCNLRIHGSEVPGYKLKGNESIPLDMAVFGRFYWGSLYFAIGERTEQADLNTTSFTCDLTIKRRHVRTKANLFN